VIAMKRPSHLTLGQIFAAPLVVAVISSLGLVSALVGDGLWDSLSWAALAVPVFLYFLFLWWRKPR
jgi:hypothetical protein